MIVAGTSPPISIDFGKDEPGMILQCWEGKDWVSYTVDGETVKSPVDIDSLPFAVYWLKTNQPPLPRPRGFLP
jgi:hypothetical protein